MRILITSGGTNVPIDPVRYISNHSTGHFGAELARAALLANQEVHYLTSMSGKSAFSHTFDTYSSGNQVEQVQQLQALWHFHDQYQAHYYEYRYHQFFDYAELLRAVIVKEQPQIVILAAAVSDYLVSNYSAQKRRSSDHLKIELEKAPKLIGTIKAFAPEVFLVGFKLLVDASTEELLAAAMHSIDQNHCDLVVANNLPSTTRDSHEVMLVEPDGSFKQYRKNAATEIIKRSLKRWGQ